jgi:hypothetical protein
MSNITTHSLRKLGFVGPYPHGEYYLFDDAYAVPTKYCCIMQVYPPGYGYYSGAARLQWNAERGMWSNNPGISEAKAYTVGQLKRYIRRSKAMKFRK